jgi:rare lipoprotein A (peptidoglycan hydrolase)
MKPKNSHSGWERLVATSGASLFLPLAILPTDIEFSTVASWYGPGFEGKKTASGQVYDQNKLTAANKELPFGTKLSVKNLTNGRTCVVVVNDRGPYVHGRGIDLSREAAKRIGMKGTAPVYCCRVNLTKPSPTLIKPRIEIIQSVIIASVKPAALSTTPMAALSTTRMAMLSTAPIGAPSTAIPHRRRGNSHTTKRAHNFQYVAYLGAKRVQFDGIHLGSKFFRIYRA